MLRSVCLSVCLSHMPLAQQPRRILVLWLLHNTESKPLTPCWKSNPLASVEEVAETATKLSATSEAFARRLHHRHVPVELPSTGAQCFAARHLIGDEAVLE